MRVVAPAWRCLADGLWAARLDHPDPVVRVIYPDGSSRVHRGDATVTWREVPPDPTAFFRGAAIAVAASLLLLGVVLAVLR